jgi:pyruvate dehydrogenase E2 component (dihydrolipoamide acetyltransferase)
MAQIIGLPKLSPTMEEGVLVKWVKKEGDAVSPGDLVAEVETDKANMDFNLEDEGVLLKLLVKEGETVKLGAPVAIIGDAGEDISALEKAAQAQLSEHNGNSTAAPAPAVAAAPGPAPAAQPRPEEPEPAAPAAAPAAAAPPRPAVAPPAPAAPSSGGGRILASPLAKSLALELGIDIRTAVGTGPGGRIVERDVRAAAEQAPAAASAAPAAAAEPPTTDNSTALALVGPRPLSIPGGPEDFVDRPLSSMRKAIARRLTESKQTIPHFYLTTQFDPEPLMRFRKALNRLVAKERKISVNDLIIKGTALALRRVPECNASFTGDAIRYYARVHLGVAVAVDDGLVTPVIRDADIKGIGVISAEVKDLADRARRKQLKGHEIQGSTFSVSNLGMFGIDHFEAVINPPEGAIVAVGTIRTLPVVDGESIRIGQRMSLTMSCDHRVIDGALGARYLDELTALLEQPELLAL